MVYYLVLFAAADSSWARFTRCAGIAGVIHQIPTASTFAVTKVRPDVQHRQLSARAPRLFSYSSTVSTQVNHTTGGIATW